MTTIFPITKMAKGDENKGKDQGKKPSEVLATHLGRAPQPLLSLLFTVACHDSGCPLTRGGLGSMSLNASLYFLYI